MTPDFQNGWIAADLDGTLFSRHQSPHPRGVPGTWRTLPDGTREPSSWMSPEAHALVAALAARFPVVAVTARDLDSYSRVEMADIPLTAGAILANGAVLVAPGCTQPDPGFTAEMDARLEAHQHALDEVLRLLAAADGPVRPRLVPGAGRHPAYLVAKAPPGWWETESGVRLVKAVAQYPFTTGVFGVELQVLPSGVSKRDGLLAFMERWTGNVRPLLTLGDMPGDAAFMQMGAFLGTPAGSPLSKLWPV